jgi:signal transduction histidine kinase
MAVVRNKGGATASKDGRMKLQGNRILIGMQEGSEREDLLGRIRHTGHLGDPRIAASWPDLEGLARALEPDVIVLADPLLKGEIQLSEAARRLAMAAPVVAIGLPERLTDLAALIQSNQVDFVPQTKMFVPHVAALVERRLRARSSGTSEFASAWLADLPTDFAEVLRHEINNPLTGILGNAELLHSQLQTKLPPIAVQRLETVIDLAVRLRETVRCLTQEWDKQHSMLHSA